jgi:CheY-like chemotaxis protein
MGGDLFLDETFDSGIPGSPGTRFTLRMNLGPMENSSRASFKGGLLEQSPEVALPNGGNNNNSASRSLPEGLSVLFVDDDTVLRRMFSRTIKRVAPTWKITEASNGETSLRLTESETFDLIFMDEYMASVEKQLLGSETVRLLRARGVTSLICGLSANDKEQQFLDAGANAFMLKPFPCQNEALKTELLLRLFPDFVTSASTPNNGGGGANP